VTAADRAKEIVGSNWESMDPSTRIAITLLAGEMDASAQREAELKHELGAVRKAMWGVVGTIVAAAIANGVLTVLQ